MGPRELPLHAAAGFRILSRISLRSRGIGECRFGSIASLWQRADHVRSTPNSGHAAAPMDLERSGVIGLVGVAPEPLRKHSENENRSGSSEGSVDGDKVVETGVIPCWADKRRKTAARERRRGFGATFYEASRPR